jgi:phosphoribosyl 1,2-cyclic phosphodiesterase
MSQDATNSDSSVAVITPTSTELRVRCWGTRGSIPSPGPTTALFGGNTPCLEVRVGERRYIFDAGTGIRVLGRRIVEEGGAFQADLFLSHFHWDHIQGIPFFGPLYDASTHLRIHGARQGDVDIQTLFAGQMGPIYFPIPFDALAATLEFAHLNGRTHRGHGVEVASIRVRHPGHTYGYRVSLGDARVAYIPDNELVGATYPVDGAGWYEGLLEFLRGVDVLYHDAMFTDAEYPSHLGWGHSTFSQAVRLAEDAGVRRLFFFHHAPERTDAELLEILDALRADVDRRGSTLELGAASEGEELLVREVKP